jgi:hypothetical protein
LGSSRDSFAALSMLFNTFDANLLMNIVGYDIDNSKASYSQHHYVRLEFKGKISQEWNDSNNRNIKDFELVEI